MSSQFSESPQQPTVGMKTSMDLAELFDVSLKISVDFMVLECQRLGFPLSAIQESRVQDLITQNWILGQRIHKVNLQCQNLGIPVLEEQALNIAKNSLVSHEMFSTGVPLSPDERVIAIEIHYQAQKRSLEKDGVFASENDQRSDSQRSIAFGEKGITTLHKIGKWFQGK